MMLERSLVEAVLSRALGGGADFAELFLEDKYELSIQYAKRNVDGITRVHIYGAGLYLLSGATSAYVYINDLSEGSLGAAVNQAVELLAAKKKGGARQVRLSPLQVESPCPVEIDPRQVGHERKIGLLREADLSARDASPLLRSIRLSFIESDQQVVIANSEGVWARDRRVASRIRLVPLLVRDGESAGHFSDYTRPQGLEAFRDGGHVAFARERVRDLHDSLYADEAPGGFYPVVLEGGSCAGTFFHEACGHQLETSRLESSLFKGKVGEQIASEKVTLVDDGTLPGQYGSSSFDDEGMPRRRNVIIEHGVLKGYLSDRLGARTYGVAPTASGRRQGYAYAPAARMSNTYLASGSDDEDEMIRSMPEGLFVTEIGGGTGGAAFTLMAQKAYWIKNGSIDRPVKGAMLLGKGNETMLRIDRVGSKLTYEANGSFCGSVSGLVATTTSGARMRVSGMLVGGKG